MDDCLILIGELLALTSSLLAIITIPSKWIYSCYIMRQSKKGRFVGLSWQTDVFKKTVYEPLTNNMSVRYNIWMGKTEKWTKKDLLKFGSYSDSEVFIFYNNRKMILWMWEKKEKLTEDWTKTENLSDYKVEHMIRSWYETKEAGFFENE